MKGALTALAAALVLAGCTSDPVEELTGCFSLSGPTDQAGIQVNEDDGQYSVRMRSDDGIWGAAQPLAAGKPETVEQVFGADADKVQASLGMADGSMTMFKVEPGTKIGGGTADSGFLAAFYFGTGQIYKTDSCDS